MKQLQMVRSFQVLQIILIISTFCNKSNKFNSSDLMLFKSYPKEYMKTNRYSKFYHDRKRLSLEQGFDNALLEHARSDGSPRVRIFVQYDGDRDVYNELIEDMINEKYRRMWVQYKALHGDCAEQEVEEQKEDQDEEDEDNAIDSSQLLYIEKDNDGVLKIEDKTYELYGNQEEEDYDEDDSYIFEYE